MQLSAATNLPGLQWLQTPCCGCTPLHAQFAPRPTVPSSAQFPGCNTRAEHVLDSHHRRQQMPKLIHHVAAATDSGRCRETFTTALPTTPFEAAWPAQSRHTRKPIQHMQACGTMRLRECWPEPAAAASVAVIIHKCLPRCSTWWPSGTLLLQTHGTKLSTHAGVI